MKFHNLKPTPGGIEAPKLPGPRGAASLTGKASDPDFALAAENRRGGREPLRRSGAGPARAGSAATVTISTPVAPAGTLAARRAPPAAAVGERLQRALCAAGQQPVAPEERALLLAVDSARHPAGRRRRGV